MRSAAPGSEREGGTAHAHLQPSFLLTLALSAGDHLFCNAASTFSAVMGKS